MAAEPSVSAEPTLTRETVPVAWFVSVWMVSMPPISRVAAAATVTADVSAIRSLPKVASVPAETTVAPV